MARKLQPLILYLTEESSINARSGGTINGQFACTDDSCLPCQLEYAYERLKDGTHIQAVQHPLESSDDVSVTVLPGFSFTVEITVSCSSAWEGINGFPTLLCNCRVLCFCKKGLDPFLK